jgi:hypothetical protein
MMCHQPSPAEQRPSLCLGADSGLKALVVAHGLGWAIDDADPVTISNGTVLRVDPQAAEALMSFSMDTTSRATTTGYDRSRQQVRRMSFYSPAVIELGQPCLNPESWRDLIDELRTEIVTAPETPSCLPGSALTAGASVVPAQRAIHPRRAHPEALPRAAQRPDMPHVAIWIQREVVLAEC